MKKYTVTVAMYTKYAHVDIEAENEDEAKDKAVAIMNDPDQHHLMVEDEEGEWELLDDLEFMEAVEEAE